MSMGKKSLILLVIAMITTITLSACNNQTDGTSEVESGNTSASFSEIENTAYTDALLKAYYLDEGEPAYSYLQNNSIRKFFDMWLDEYMGEETKAQWDYTTLAPVQLLDHDFNSIADEDTELYTCTYTTVNGEIGYIIVAYYEDGPSIQQWSLHETTPHHYDFRANMELIVAALAETDIDLSTATATRVEWIDTDKNRGDRIILFSDGKGDRYVYYYGDDEFSLEKQ